MAHGPDDEAKPHTHLIDFPEALEAFFSRVGELRAVLGPDAASGVDRLEALIGEGLAARDRGDMGTAVRQVTAAMEHLANLASRLDSAEGPMLRAMAEHFRQALGRGAIPEAREAADVMRERSGSTLTPKKRS